MEFVFTDDEFLARYVDVALAVRAWGDLAGHAYVRLLDTMAAADTVSNLHRIASLRLHQLKGLRREQWAMTIHGRWRLVVRFEGDVVFVEEVSNHYGD